MKKLLLPLCCLLFANMSAAENNFAWQKLFELTEAYSGIGARPAGSEKEHEAAYWIKSEWESLGYQVTEYKFDATLKGKKKQSSNLSILCPVKARTHLL
jgi:hypothetical protein